jgi:thiamine biosynthesis lipoprotein
LTPAVTDLLTSVTFPALGTTATVLVTDPGVADVARQILEAELSALDAACSRFRADSELNRLNQSAGAAIRVSRTMLEAVGVALRTARLTEGLVDPTVGEAVRLLGYDRTFADVERAGPPLRITLGRVPGWQLIGVDEARSTIRLPVGVELDLGATAKAWCADQAARLIAEATGAGVLVSLGGDLAIGGPSPGSGWSVRVTDDHAATPDAPGQTVLVGSGGLATSSTSVRRWARGQEQLHHIVDPATGCSARSKWRTVSVAAASCVDANSAATAAVVLGDRAPAWLAERRLPSRLTSQDGEVTIVGGWPPADRSDPPARDETCSP